MLTQTQEKQEKYQEVLQAAETLFRQNPDWVTFFREILGVEGAVRTAFPSFDALTKFEQSPEFDRIQKLLVRLREKRSATDTESEPTRVITVRLPKSMHEYLRSEAHDLHTSMNKLCISKLLQVIDEGMIPNERSGGGPSSSASSRPEAGPPAAAMRPMTTASTNGLPGGHVAESRPALFTPTSAPTSPLFKPQPRF